MTIPLPLAQVLFFSQTHVQNFMFSSIILLLRLRHRPRRAFLLLCVDLLLQELVYRADVLVWRPISRSLHSNGSTGCNIVNRIPIVRVGASGLIFAFVFSTTLRGIMFQKLSVSQTLPWGPQIPLIMIIICELLWDKWQWDSQIIVPRTTSI
jgi:hypothetical protein